jgi:hypothetical protein
MFFFLDIFLFFVLRKESEHRTKEDKVKWLRGSNKVNELESGYLKCKYRLISKLHTILILIGFSASPRLCGYRRYSHCGEEVKLNTKKSLKCEDRFYGL